MFKCNVGWSLRGKYTQRRLLEVTLA